MQIKALTKKFFRLFGLDIIKYTPRLRPLDFAQYLKINCVLDIGANVGQFAHEIRSSLPNAQIISFEPLPICFEKLKESMKEDKNFTAHNIALGDEKGEMMMHQNEYTPSSSILELDKDHLDYFPKARQTKDIKIQIEKLDDIANTLNIQGNVLVKMDVQGYEKKVIGGGVNTIKNARAVLIEISFADFYKGQPTFSELHQILNEMGFKYHGSTQRKVDQKTGLVLSEDSLFVR